MLQDMIETSYFEVDMAVSAKEPANVFGSYSNIGKCELWKKSNKPLRIKHLGKVIAELSPWGEIKQDSFFKNKMNPSLNPYGKWTWIPTWNLYVSHLYKLYDEEYGKTQSGNIKTTPYKASLSADPQTIIGNLGEEIIEDHYKSTRSYWFDKFRDGTVNTNLVYEVKTLQLNEYGGSTPGFWVGLDQGPKIDGVDILFFIQVPKYEDDLAICYVCVNHKNCWTREYCSDGTPVRNYPLTNCLYQFTIDKDKSSSMLEMSKKISKWRK